MTEEEKAGEVQPEEVEAPLTETPSEEPPVVVDEVPEVDPETLAATIKELEEKKKKAQDEWYYWRDRAAKKRAKIGAEEPVPPPEPAVSPPPAAPTMAEPREGDFDTYEDYVKAVADFRAEAKIQEFEAKRRQALEKERVQEHEEAYWKKMSVGIQKYDDFEDVALAPTNPITQQMAAIIMESEHSADLAYYLGKNIQECVAIGRMTPTQATIALGKIEAEIQSQPSTTTNPTTNAPPPITPIAGAGSEVRKDPARMTYQEYRKWRESGGGR